MEGTFQRDMHVAFFKHSLKQVLPSHYESLDTNRMTLAFFVLSGLDVLDALDVLSNEYKSALADWIYAQQVVDDVRGGFRGGPFLGTLFGERLSTSMHDCGHLAMTYVAILMLKVLNDDLNRLAKPEILSSLAHCQLSTGAFSPHYLPSESDVRFAYCALAICSLLDDFSHINVPLVSSYLHSTWRYDGGFGQNPGLEGHGGSTFCSLAAQAILRSRKEQGENAVRCLEPSKLALTRNWLLSLLTENGLCGRPNKPEDCCYTWWVVASLHCLEVLEDHPYPMAMTVAAEEKGEGEGEDPVDFAACECFVLNSQDGNRGGIGRDPTAFPDPMHSYLALAGMSLVKTVRSTWNLLPVHPALNITIRSLQSPEED
jgi:geranylgeranyl transferase type-1 subunit beta